MILLTSTSDLVQVITGGTQVVHVHASFVDFSSGTATPGCLNTIINSAVTTTVVASPAGSTQRNVKVLSIRNTDTTNPAAITIQHTDGTNVVPLQIVSLLPGYTLLWNDIRGWELINALGIAV